MKISSKHLHSQTVIARELKFKRRFTCPHVSHVTCHVSHVPCPMSHVNYYIIFLFVLFIYTFWGGQSGEASCWRVCYQRDLPRLVLKPFALFCEHCLVPSSKAPSGPLALLTCMIYQNRPQALILSWPAIWLEYIIIPCFVTGWSLI